MIIDDVCVPGIYIVKGTESLRNRIIFFAHHPGCGYCKLPEGSDSVHVLPGSANIFEVHEHAPKRKHGDLVEGEREIISMWVLPHEEVLRVRDVLKQGGYLK